MKLSIVIMAHPKRKAWAEELSKKLFNSEIVYDEKNNVWDTCRRSWLAIDKRADYGIVIQDDAILCSEFIDKLAYNLFELDKDYVVSLYSGKQAAVHIKKALENNKDHFINEFIFNEIALAMKTEFIHEMISFCDNTETKTDHEISNWAKKKGLKIYNTIPSLVDHRDEESIYRLNYFGEKNKKENRKAFLFEAN